MNKYLHIKNFLNQLDDELTVEKVNDIVDKIKIFDSSILFDVYEPNGWTVLKDQDVKISKYVDNIKFALKIHLENIPNYTKVKNLDLIIQEGEKTSNNKMYSEFLRKVKTIYDKEINFPATLNSKLNTESVLIGYGNVSYKIEREDVNCILVILNNYMEDLLSQSKSKKQASKKENVINITNAPVVNVNVDINVLIQNTITEIEEDDDLSDEDVSEIKSIIKELKEVKNEKPKKKWEKCKKAIAWLGDKTVKFGKWIIPIIAQILTQKAGTAE